MLKNERKINYLVGLAGKGNDQHRSWTGIQINFWPLVHPWPPLLCPHLATLGTDCLDKHIIKETIVQTLNTCLINKNLDDVSSKFYDIYA
jgi:hypothetical protein